MATAKSPRTAAKTAARKSKSVPKSKKLPNAIALLRADHQAVSELFAQFAKARSGKRKAELASKIGMELTVHAQIEEEIFYPAFAAATKDKELVPEATVEHQTMKDLIAQIDSGNVDDALYDAKVTVLGEYVKHHVKEEQNEIFPKARKSKLDLEQLGAQLHARKAELIAAYG